MSSHKLEMRRPFVWSLLLAMTSLGLIIPVPGKLLNEVDEATTTEIATTTPFTETAKAGSSSRSNKLEMSARNNTQLDLKVLAGGVNYQQIKTKMDILLKVINDTQSVNETTRNLFHRLIIEDVAQKKEARTPAADGSSSRALAHVLPAKQRRVYHEPTIFFNKALKETHGNMKEAFYGESRSDPSIHWVVLYNDTTLLVLRSADRYYYWTYTQTFGSGIIFFMIVVGNLSILYRLKSCRRRRSNVNYFIVQLAIADLLVGIFCVTLDSWLRLHRTFVWGLLACRVSKYFSVLFIYASTNLLVALSVDRWEAVVKPLAFTKNRSRGYHLVAASWILAFLFAMPVTFHTRIKDIDGLPQCWIDLDSLGWQLYMIYLTSLLLVLPTLIIAVCYIHIVYTIWSKSQLVSGQQRQRERNNNYRASPDSRLECSSTSRVASRLSSSLRKANQQPMPRPWSWLFFRYGSPDERLVSGCASTVNKKPITTGGTIASISSRRVSSDLSTLGLQSATTRRAKTFRRSKTCRKDRQRHLKRQPGCARQSSMRVGGEPDRGEFATQPGDNITTLWVADSSSSSSSSASSMCSRLQPDSLVTAQIMSSRANTGHHSTAPRNESQTAQLTMIRNDELVTAPCGQSAVNSARVQRPTGYDNLGQTDQPETGLMSRSTDMKPSVADLKLGGDCPTAPAGMARMGRTDSNSEASLASECHVADFCKRKQESPLKVLANMITMTTKREPAGGNKLIPSDPDVDMQTKSRKISGSCDRAERRAQQGRNSSTDTQQTQPAPPQTPPPQPPQLSLSTPPPLQATDCQQGGGRDQDFVGQQHGSGVIPKARIKTIKMTLVIVVAYILCWTPFLIFNLLSVFGMIRNDTNAIYALRTFSQSLAHLNSAVNPIIFWLFSSKRNQTSANHAHHVANAGHGGGAHMNHQPAEAVEQTRRK